MRNCLPFFEIDEDFQMAESKGESQVFSYTADWTIYAVGFSARKDQKFRLAIGSFLEENENKVGLASSRGFFDVLVYRRSISSNLMKRMVFSNARPPSFINIHPPNSFGSPHVYIYHPAIYINPNLTWYCIFFVG